MSIGKEYLATAIRRMKYYKDLGEKTFEQLEEKDFHFQPSSESNSIAVIVQHMTGNMLSRWTNFLTEDGEKEWRDRNDEFEIHQYSKQQVIDLWNKGWSCFLQAVESLTENDLIKTVSIRQEQLYPYHIGQIVFIGRLIKNKDWKNLSIPKGQSQAYNTGSQAKDPAKKYS